MSTTTSRLGLVKPAGAEVADIAVINSNMDKIDNSINVSIVATLAAITTPYNGQFAYATDTKQLRFYISGSWLLVAAGDQATGNPDRITVPNDTLASISDNSNGFQVGLDAGANVAHDANDIQARNAGVAATLKLNRYGGNVEIGTSGQMIISDDGIKSTSMASVEAADTTNITVTSTSYVNGTPDVYADCVAPPSGRFLVILTGQIRANTASTDDGYLSFRTTVTPGGTTFANEGLEGNTLRVTNGYIAGSVADIIGGATPGTTYRFKVYHKKGDSGDTVSILTRKIVVLPIW